MFLRKITKKNGKRYWYVLKSVYDRKRGYPVHKKVADLSGFSDEMVYQIEKMLKGEELHRKQSLPDRVLRVLESRYFGPLKILDAFLEELELEKLSFLKRKQIRDLKALVLARASEPIKCRSELRSAEWLRKSGINFILGGRASSWDRNKFYTLLGELSTHWTEIEDHLWKKRNSAPRLYFYDITSTYFEGRGGSFAQLGYSRDEKSCNPQLILALLTDQNSFPIAIRILPGNTRDSSTVKASVEEIKKRFGAEKLTLIMDRGMKTEANVETLLEHGFNYIMALSHTKARTLLQDQKRLEWEELFDKRHLAEWIADGKRYIVCRNPLVADKDEKTLENILAKAEKRLAALSELIRKKRLIKKEKILIRVVKILTQTKTEKYFEYNVEDGKLEYHRNETANLSFLYSGCYVLETSLNEVDKKEIDTAYRAEHQIEEVFRSWKDEMHLRPNFHIKDKNIFGHIYLTFLSYLMIKKLETKLKTLGINERGSTFLNRFDNIMLNLIEINNEKEYVVTTPDRKQATLLNLLGIEIDFKKRRKKGSL